MARAVDIPVAGVGVGLSIKTDPRDGERVEADGASLSGVCGREAEVRAK